jgi:hypothetical protein
MASSSELDRLIRRGEKARLDAIDAVENSRRIFEQNLAIQELSRDALTRWHESNAEAKDFLRIPPPRS